MVFHCQSSAGITAVVTSMVVVVVVAVTAVIVAAICVASCLSLAHVSRLILSVVHEYANVRARSVLYKLNVVYCLVADGSSARRQVCLLAWHRKEFALSGQMRRARMSAVL